MPHDTQTAGDETHPTAKSIFIVEDDTAIGEFLVQAISQETSYHALLAPDGFAALKMLKDLKPDLFILDYQLPGMNGIELYDQLQADKNFKDIPAILMTASSRTLRNDIGKRDITLLGKPVELDRLLETIEKLLTSE